MPKMIVHGELYNYSAIHFLFEEKVAKRTVRPALTGCNANRGTEFTEHADPVSKAHSKFRASL